MKTHKKDGSKNAVCSGTRNNSPLLQLLYILFSDTPSGNLKGKEEQEEEAPRMLGLSGREKKGERRMPGNAFPRENRSRRGGGTQPLGVKGEGLR